MTEIKDGTMKDVLVKLRTLSDEIEEINRRFGTVDRTSNRYKSDLADLRRQVERGSTPLPPRNQQVGTFPILMYSGERSSLSRFLKEFHTWALSSRSEDALSNSRPVILTGDKSRRELEIKYGRQIVAQSLTVWNGLTKAVKKDKSVTEIVVRAKAPSEAWKILKSMVEDDSSEKAKEQAKKNFEGLSMDSAESMKEYIARAKSLALNVQYHDVEVTDQEISRRVLNGLPPPYAPEKRNFALKPDFSLAKLEGGLVRVEELNRSSDGTDGNHALAAGFKARSGGRSGGRGGHNGGGRGKRDGKGQPQHQQQRPQHQQQQPQYQPWHQQQQPQQQQYQPQHQQQQLQQQQYQPWHQQQQPQHQAAASERAAARASAAISAAAPAISATGAATAVPEVPAAPSAAAARTALSGTGFITHLFQVW